LQALAFLEAARILNELERRSPTWRAAKQLMRMAASETDVAVFHRFGDRLSDSASISRLRAHGRFVSTPEDSSQTLTDKNL